MESIADATVTRLLIYKRILGNLAKQGRDYLFSNELAALTDNKAALVRRDLMHVSVHGSAAHGYSIAELISGIDRMLGLPQRQPVVLAGVGNIGKALLNFFGGQQSRFQIIAAFDNDPFKAGRLYNGVRVYTVAEIFEVCAREKVHMAIVATPAEVAQSIVDELLLAGVNGFMNFTPVLLRVPDYAYVNNTDISLNLETIAFQVQNKGVNGYAKH
jgi:redox-sensing transcriptional repressor